VVDVETRSPRQSAALVNADGACRPWSAMLDAIDEAVVAVDRGGRVVALNRAGARLTGWAADEALGAPLAEVFARAADPPDPLLDAVAAALGGAPDAAPVDAEVRARQGGEPHGVRCRVVAWREGDALLGALVTAVSRERELVADRNAHRVEERFRSFFDDAPIGKSMTGPDGRLLRVNDAFGAMLGRSREEMERISYADITHPEDLEQSLTCVTDLLAGRADHWVMEKRYRHADGRYVWARVTTAIERDADGAPLYFLTHAQDISELRAQREALVESNRELEQFAYVASHDLQEPLRMVASFTQLLAKRYGDALDEDARDYIRFAVDGANRMQRLIQDLLSYARVGSRGRELTPISLSGPLADALVALQTVIRETGAMIVQRDLPVVRGDRGQLMQLFQNLIGNAIKFRRADEPPRIAVSTTHANGEWVIAVRDNGIGIEARYFERVFTIFQRLHAQHEYPGTGIGLPLCKRIVNRHGGRIWLESEPGAGTTFYFTLPDTVSAADGEDK
jgi:PAS domain S-box-containing protein